ncbi:type II secretion system protein G [Treponema vincentii F0403]|uniref:Type II secretion system protein G n=1 Tax=Treponema vincentii F0403 TaxID=1125702 RepID=S3LBN6_9SPIR|nr:type II secretion system major pseudopilin GspG [Treponema vincentii]EPF47858.1 type II secretion system protein G [Treponema vincentii F0403]
MTVKKDKGFTLPETLVVIAIILILSATVGFSAFKFVGKAKTTACKNQIEIFKIALQAYYLDCGAYPSGGQGLQALWEKPILAPIPANWNGPYLDREIPSDPWNNQYVYKVPGDNNLPYTIISYGADGKEGGEGNDADIISWKR